MKAPSSSSATLTSADAKPLFASLGKPAILALGDIPATRARDLLDVFGAPLLDRVAPAAGGKRLVTEVELLGPHTAKATIEKDAGKGKFKKINEHADRLEAQRTEVHDSIGLNERSLIVDSQMMIPVRKLMNGEPWMGKRGGPGLSAGERAMIDKLRSHAGLPPIAPTPPEYRVDRRDLESLIGKQDLRGGNVTLGEIGPGVGVRGIELTVQRTDPLYTHMLDELARSPAIGGSKGAADRAVVADALFAAREGDHPPTLMTSDEDIYVRLATRYAPRQFKQKMVNGEQEGVASTIVREAPHGFEIRIPDRDGLPRSLKVVPVSEEERHDSTGSLKERHP